MRDRPKVGEILIQAGIIDELQLASALGEQTRWGRRLGMTLIKLGMVQEGQLVRALAKQFDLPVASLSGKKIAPEVIALVPAKVALEHSVIPLFVKKDGPKGQLFLGMEEPSDLGVLDDLAFRTGMLIRPVMVGPSEIGEAIDRYYTTRSAPAAPAASPSPEPARPGDTLSETNLRRIREEAPTPAPPLGLVPSHESIFAPIPAPAAVTPATPAVPHAPAAVTPAPAAVLPAVSSAVPLAKGAPAPASPEPTEEVTAPVQPAVVASPVLPPAPPAIAASPAVQPAPPVQPIAVPVAATPAPAPTPAQVAAPAAASSDALALERAHLLEETERTRLVAKAIAHLLIEKGVLTYEELQARIEKMKPKSPTPDSAL